jgi:lipopolysaccharide/colanic/teichoic acid biosynthesis glycosyltransferase
MSAYKVQREAMVLEKPFMTGGQGRANSTRSGIERVADIVIASALIALLLPLMVIVAIAVKCDSRGPILVWERRQHPSEREFWALKFRCTVREPRVQRFAETEATFVGGIIRYLRIDTLPQLVNVLRGEMTCLPTDPDYQFFLE